MISANAKERMAARAHHLKWVRCVASLCTYGVWRDIHLPLGYEPGYPSPIVSTGISGADRIEGMLIRRGTDRYVRLVARSGW